MKYAALLSRMGKWSPFSKIHELIRELKVARVMTTPVVTISSDAAMADVKEQMRIHRISGMPVVDDGVLVGLISTADLILALEKGETGRPIRDYMTTQLILAQDQEPVLEALRRLETTGVGRLPVVDKQGKLVGILTRGDVVAGLLQALQQAYDEVEKAQGQPRRFFEALESDETSLLLRYYVKVGDFTHGGQASARLKQALLQIGASPQLARRVAIATYEAEINLIIHTTAGGQILAELRPDHITVVVQDTGPGIPDVNLARQPGYSTASQIAREMGFGAGMGLTNIERCADGMDIWSVVGIGTRLEMMFRVPEDKL